MVSKMEPVVIAARFDTPAMMPRPGNNAQNRIVDNLAWGFFGLPDASPGSRPPWRYDGGMRFRAQVSSAVLVLLIASAPNSWASANNSETLRAYTLEAPAAQYGTSRAAPAQSPDARNDQSADSLTVLVNKTHPLDPIRYAPTDLLQIGTVELRAEAANQLADLLAAAKANNTPLSTQSGYRSYGTQSATFAKWVAQYGTAHAQMYSAAPGYSEHQTGLAVDLIPATGSCQMLSRCVADTPAGKWLADNAALYGFIMRYEKDTALITGYNYEPWHYRYIGVDLAQQYVSGDFHTLEEYLQANAVTSADKSSGKPRTGRFSWAGIGFRPGQYLAR